MTPKAFADSFDRLDGGHGGEHGVVTEDGERWHGRHHIPATGTLETMVNRRAELSIGWVGPDTSRDEAAAVIAAVQRFIRDTAPPLASRPPRRDPWQQAALREGVDRPPREPLPWG